MKERLRVVCLGTMSLACSVASWSALTFPDYISDNMILQQNSTFRLKGHTTPGSRVKITPGWLPEGKVVVADREGNLEWDMPTPPAGGPYSLVFEEKDGRRVIENILSGEVWFCSGQSNMEFPVQGWTTVMDYDREVATAYHPDIRLLQVRKRTSLTPCEDLIANGGGWQVCNSASMADFSAIAYFFARELSEKLKVPVGVVDATWGGTPAEAWTSYTALGGVPGFSGELADLKKGNFSKEGVTPFYNQRLQEWMGLTAPRLGNFNKGEYHSGGEWRSMTAPGYWENSVLPDFDGVVWLQREIDLPAELAGKPFTLDFRAIDDEDVTYFNGVQVGSGSGYDTPRHYEAGKGVSRAGKNVLTICVKDFEGEGGIAPGIAEMVVGDRHIPLSGEWSYLVDNDFSRLPSKPASPEGSSYPTTLYNAMVHPLMGMPVRGVLWYQGCANVGRAEQYAPLFQSLIKDWRTGWGSELPFYFVQLAGFRKVNPVQPDSEWAALRDAQAQALALDNTSMVVALDLGNPADIHPKDKQDVAHRLALTALSREYGSGDTYRAPECISVQRKGDRLRLEFDGPVCPTSTAVTGFIISGKDGKFTTATPSVEGERVLWLSSPEVKHPEAVKYNWADFPIGNLYGETGLPVAPFSKHL